VGGAEARQARRVAAGELYGLPLEEFTRARDALARRLRENGDRAAADAVRALPKPTVAAWAVNQLARRHLDDVAALLDAGAALRTAHERLLAGERDAGLDEAAAAERAAIVRLVGHARALGASAQTLERVAQTLHAAAGSEEVRDALAAGTLAREQAPSPLAGLGLGDGGAAARAPPRRARPARRGTSPPAAPRPGKRERPDAAAAERERAEAERAARLREAKALVRRVRREHERARKASAAARGRVDRLGRELAARAEEARLAGEAEERAAAAVAEAERELRALGG
jgi:hypothetical protein